MYSSTLIKVIACALLAALIHASRPHEQLDNRLVGKRGMQAQARSESELEIVKRANSEVKRRDAGDPPADGLAGGQGAGGKTPAAGAAAGITLTVGGNGQYRTIQQAITSAASKCAGGAVTVFVNAGTYREQVRVPGSIPCKLIVKGATSGGKNLATITNNQAGSPYTVTATMLVEANDFAMYNVNVENTFGRGKQAIALYARGQGRQAYYGCSFSGYQDTCYADAAKIYFRGCSISGATDFIFGQNGNAWLESCRITPTSYGWVTAAGRNSPNAPGIIVLNKCDIDGPGKAQSFLGRPWGTYARAVVQNSQLGAVIKPAGWDKMHEDKPGAKLEEYGNTGPGARGPRSPLGSKLSKPVEISEVLGDTQWIDQ